MAGQETRNKLTDYWADHDIKAGQEFAIFTNLIHEEWAGRERLAAPMRFWEGRVGRRPPRATSLPGACCSAAEARLWRGRAGRRAGASGRDRYCPTPAPGARPNEADEPSAGGDIANRYV